MRIKTVLRIFIAIVLASCETKKKPDIIIPDKNFHPLQKSSNSFIVQPLQNWPNSIIGNWEASGFIYHIELLVNNDSTFKYYYSSDLGEGYSEGRWSKSENFFVLTSFEKYKTLNDLEQFERNVYFDHIPFQFIGDSLCQFDKFGKSVTTKFGPKFIMLH